MRHVARTILAVLLGVWIGTAAIAETQSYRLEVNGLACPFCAYGIEKKLQALDGVARLETNIKEGTVVVTMKDGATLDESTAEQAVANAGFTLEGFEPVPSSDPR